MIDILLALYNCEDFISEQIESIISQTNDNWRLIICDDCSVDKSYKIAAGYAARFPEKIKIYKNEKPTGSAQANFMNMLRYAESEYIMFSDHDDVWLPYKVEATFEKMRQIESDKNLPLLVHSELLITDRNMNVIHEKFTEYQGLNPKLKTLNRLLVQNNVTGCTVMINRKMLEIIKNIPSEKMLMHDWWFALAASAFGEIAFIETPLIKYRQHTGNQLGAVNNRSLKGAFRIIRDRCGTKKRVSVTFDQAKDFYECYRNMFSEQDLECIEKYLKIPEKNKLFRILLLLRGGYLKQSVMTALGQLIFS